MELIIWIFRRSFFHVIQKLPSTFVCIFDLSAACICILCLLVLSAQQRGITLWFWRSSLIVSGSDSVLFHLPHCFVPHWELFCWFHHFSEMTPVNTKGDSSVAGGSVEAASEFNLPDIEKKNTFVSDEGQHQNTCRCLIKTESSVDKLFIRWKLIFIYVR